MHERKTNILIVDDTPANLRLLQQSLGDRGYQVRPATNGPQAIAAATASPPDLILLDINMPEMNGYEVCQILKSKPETESIPVIFISALDKTEDKVKALSQGGVDYITKPFQIEEVFARVETHLKILTLQRDLKDRNGELSAFGRMVAHDLKTPLMTVGMAVDMMHRDEAARTPESFGHIKSALHKIEEIIDSLFLLSSVGREEVELGPLDMMAILRESQTALTHLSGEHAAQFSITPQPWPTAVGYAPWVGQVWTNYLSNAVKYGGRPPQVLIGADPAQNGHVRFWVRDNGHGLTPEQCGQLFREFSRLGETEIAGHGLGLSIVARIVGKLGGKVGVESEPGKGSIFYFTLPEHRGE